MTGHELEPAQYGEVLSRLKAEVRAAQLRAQRTVNTALLELFWTIGSEILAQQQALGWGAKVIDQLARDLRAEFPDMRGLTRSNLYYMRSFAAAWPDRAIVPTLLGRLSWEPRPVPARQARRPQARTWYAAEATRRGWTRAAR